MALISFTLDTNCLIDVDDDRPAKSFVLALLEAAKSGVADVAIVASSAAERQSGGGHLSDFGQFQQRMNQLGFGHVGLLMPIAHWDLCFFDYCIYATDAQMACEDRIFRILFPNGDPSWEAYAKEKWDWL